MRGTVLVFFALPDKRVTRSIVSFHISEFSSDGCIFLLLFLFAAFFLSCLPAPLNADYYFSLHFVGGWANLSKTCVMVMERTIQLWLPVNVTIQLTRSHNDRLMKRRRAKRKTERERVSQCSFRAEMLQWRVLASIVWCFVNLSDEKKSFDPSCFTQTCT